MKSFLGLCLASSAEAKLEDSRWWQEFYRSEIGEWRKAAKKAWKKQDKAKARIAELEADLAVARACLVIDLTDMHG